VQLSPDLLPATPDRPPIPAAQQVPASRRGTTTSFEPTDARRSVVFHVLGVLVPIPVVAVAIAVGGYRPALIAFGIGAALHSVSHLVLLAMTRKDERYRSRTADVFRVLSIVGLQPSVCYFSPLSAAVIIPMQAIMYSALGRVRWVAIMTTVVCACVQFAVALAIILGWTHDVGILAPVGTSVRQLVTVELIVLAFLISGYALGRWARGTGAAAFTELERAMRIIGDREQALAEVAADAARQRCVNEGRWTNQTLGQWCVGLVLGRGAMGEVYEAVGPNQQPAALKLLVAVEGASHDSVARFHREMKIASQLESPHLVKVLELSPPGSAVPYIAMERLYGVDLATRLRSEHRIPVDELALLLDQIARGLEVAHVAGVVHRDLKPHNVFHHQRSVWKILDFGISKIVGSDGTLTGARLVGTPTYMAPEQASGGAVTAASDIYSLGAIAYRCLTGRTLFKGDELAELVYQVVHAPPVRPSELANVPTEVEDVLAVALAKDPRKRFSSATTLARAFADARRGLPVGIEVPSSAWA
jgi:serine/threonine-protein kinase